MSKLGALLIVNFLLYTLNFLIDLFFIGKMSTGGARGKASSSRTATPEVDSREEFGKVYKAIGGLIQAMKYQNKNNGGNLDKTKFGNLVAQWSNLKERRHQHLKEQQIPWKLRHGLSKWRKFLRF